MVDESVPVVTRAAMERFESRVAQGGSRAEARADARALRSGDHEATFRIAAQCLSVATAVPEHLVEVYDGLAEGWLGHAPDGEAIGATGATFQASPVPSRLWDALWELVLDPGAGRDPADITVRTAALTGLLPPEFHRRVAAMALRYPGVAEASAAGVPPRFTLEALAACPAGSLGGQLHSLVVDDGFDLEVLDRDALDLAELPPPLEYLNIRILQCHDIWHLVAGYETTGLHEVAISGFQMAQFGHQYSSMFLGMVLTKVAFTEPFEGMGFLLDTVLSAYTHGRQTPPLLGVEWEAVWDRPVTAIRAAQGVAPYDSPYPAGLLEELRSA
jgi:ubiquinone biosynthesis protein Coq4